MCSGFTANPVKSKLSYSLNDGDLTEIDFSGEHIGQTNIAADGKPDLRFVAWIRVGTVALKKGANEIHFRMNSDLSKPRPDRLLRARKTNPSSPTERPSRTNWPMCVAR